MEVGTLLLERGKGYPRLKKNATKVVENGDKVLNSNETEEKEDK